MESSHFGRGDGCLASPSACVLPVPARIPPRQGVMSEHQLEESLPCTEAKTNISG